MASQGPALEKGEAQKVIDFVIKRAMQLQTRDLTKEAGKSVDVDFGYSIQLEELVPLMKADLAEEHKMNRIRWKMRNAFREAKIRQKCIGTSYEFILDPSIDIGLRKDAPQVQRQASKTFTKFDEPFIAPGWFGDLLDALEFGSKPIIVGPQGCGKSRAAEEALAHRGLRVFRIALGQYHDPADLIGTKEVVSENGVPVTKLVGGLLTKALTNGWGLILDEYDMMVPQMLAAINQVMESNGNIILDDGEGDPVVIEVHPDARIIATANTWGHGDSTGKFAGAQEQNDASWDRLRPKMPHGYDYAIEKRLVSRHLSAKVIEALYGDDPAPNKMGIVRLIRNAIEDEHNPIQDTLGLRSILFFAQTYKIYGWSKGIFYLLHEFREENREPIAKMITTRFGIKFCGTRNDYDKDAPNYIPDLMPAIIQAGFGN